MSKRIRCLARAALASATLALLWVGPAVAVTGSAPLDGARDGVGPAVPEPGAAILFALGAGAVAWGARRQRAAR